MKPLVAQLGLNPTSQLQAEFRRVFTQSIPRRINMFDMVSPIIDHSNVPVNSPNLDPFFEYIVQFARKALRTQELWDKTFELYRHLKDRFWRSRRKKLDDRFAFLPLAILYTYENHFGQYLHILDAFYKQGRGQSLERTSIGGIINRMKTLFSSNVQGILCITRITRNAIGHGQLEYNEEQQIITRLWNVKHNGQIESLYSVSIDVLEDVLWVMIEFEMLINPLIIKWFGRYYQHRGNTQAIRAMMLQIGLL